MEREEKGFELLAVLVVLPVCFNYPGCATTSLELIVAD